MPPSGTGDLYEAPSRIEPALLDEPRMGTVDRMTALVSASQALGGRLPPRSAESLAGVVRVMNCYYSNLIEGHNTTLREIEAALRDDLAADEARRNLQIEARAHIRLQEQIDGLHAEGCLPDPASADFIRMLHREFYRDATEAMLTVSSGGTTLRMTPGAFRARPEEEVTIGRHHPPSPHRVADTMDYFARRYAMGALGPGARVLALAAAHHRFNFIHPFLDGNGRVSRLMSHAMALNAGIGAHGLWSVSRGLARGLRSRDDYKAMMAFADSPRMGDLDGRGNLSRKALTEFTDWFLDVCLDQVAFMGKLFDLANLKGRLRHYTDRQGMKPGAILMLEQALVRGEVPRGEASLITGLGERAARTLLGALLEDGILGSETPKGPVSLRFPAQAVEILFPGL